MFTSSTSLLTLYRPPKANRKRVFFSVT
ncbi:Uncharacterized protein APZ42_027282 [Daphnia magna]|uniref:Uncharacterized protein n=1 Tax=Daphnia magna TaxID=35525 RepID=A0A164RED7_9CRUS|nr:Uncharacterized protein APZ42_027282 [Daphnia magna]